MIDSSRVSTARFFERMVATGYPAPPALALLAPHQRAAVARLCAMLAIHRGALLADDVGLGKSYVAAAVAKAAADEGDDVEFIVPASLVGQWTELLRRFGAAFPVVSHDALLRCGSVPRTRRHGLLIVDEAHRFRNPATQRYRSLALRAIARKLLLVTATPVCNGASDLEALLRLLVADDALRLRGVESISRAFEEKSEEELSIVAQELVVRRDRRALTLNLQFGALRREIVKFRSLAGTLRPALLALRFPLIAQGPDVRLLRLLVERRAESSRAALVDTLQRQRRFYRRAREALLDGRTLTKPEYRRIFGDDEEGAPFQDLLFRELWLPPPAARDALPAVERELEALDTCLAAAAACDDVKPGILHALVAAVDTPLIVYTAAIATARALHRSLSPDWRVGLVTSKEAALRSAPVHDVPLVFDAMSRGELDVVVTTDLGAEGLNLQAATAVVHYDVPWNPVRLDQRNGRAHRIGQRRDTVRAIYFVPEQAVERTVLRAVVSKNRVRRGLLEDERSYARSAAVDRAVLAGEPIGERVALLVEGDSETALVLVSFGSRMFLFGARRGRLIDCESQLLTLVGELSGSGVAVPIDAVDLGAALARIERRLRSRLLLPGRLAPTAPQCVLSPLAERAVSGVDLAPVLRRAYRAGPRFLLQEVANEYLDAARAIELRCALDADRQPDALPTSRVALVAAIVTVSSIRDAVGEPRAQFRCDGYDAVRRFYLGAMNSGIPPLPSFTDAYA